MKWSWTGPISAQLAIGEAYYESEPRPGLVDGAHLVVDEPCGEADLAHRVLVQIGRQRTQRRRELVWCGDEPEPRARRDAQLLRQRRPGISGHALLLPRHELRP